MATGRSAADSAFDFMDKVVGGVETFYGKGSRPAAGNPPAADPNAKQLASGWKVREVKSASGAPTFLVTNGTDYAACSTRELAERVCMLLGGTP